MSAIAPTRVQATRAYRRKLGDYEITALSDGFVDLSFGVWQGIEQEAFDAALTDHFMPTGGFRNGITSFIINTGAKIIMIDAGAAGLFGPNSYHFPDNLAHAGLTAADIDLVIPTHAHPDHIGALLKDGQASLPNAEIRVNQTELDFWTSEAAQAKAPDFMRGWWDLVRGVDQAYAGRLTSFADNAALGDGITHMPFPGHTPGHSGYLIESAGERLLIWGDLVVHHAIQFPHPQASMIFDIDSGLGHQSRLRGLDLAATDKLLTAATHLPFPTFGYVARRADAYQWVPETWRYDVSGLAWQPVV